MTLLLCQLALAESDTIGGTSEYNDNADMLKLVEVEVDESAAITQLSFAVYGREAGADVFLVAYRRAGDRFELVGSALGTIVEGDEHQWAESGDVSWLLEAGQAYAIGAFVGEGWYYFYQDDRTDSPWFGGITGSYQVESDVRDTVEVGQREAHYYYMRVDSVAADQDGDGFASQEVGGTDCDDGDAAVGEASAEVPYDGIDQDCSGSDLVDVDGDGVAAMAVGGADCDDNDAGIVPGADDVCDDGIDQDCAGGDATCGEGGADSTGGDSVIDASPDCGCNAGANIPAAAAVVMGAMTTRRRRA